jgi:hypothetical protein
MKIHLLALAFLFTLAHTQIVEHCENGGFIVVNGEGNHECFCHGTGFYGSYCNISCPPSFPVECINI